MTIKEVCEKIQLQSELTEKICAFADNFDFESIRPQLEKLKRIETGMKALTELRELLKTDPGEIKILACNLKCAAEQYENYMKKGISDEIFTETMKCFSRFARECFVRTGEYAFDRAFWTTRQIAMVLFRIGELEFELNIEEGEHVINVHIPSDADISDENCEDSIARARDFMKEFYPEYDGVEYLCDSWLLAPVLKEFLKESSKIIRFQNRFEIYKEDLEDTGFTEWLYHTREYRPEEFAEDTSLQRSIKAYVLNGGKVGCGYGKLLR